jgi:predicted metallo-beta-lactamase superfamily hydrolase
MICLPCIKVYTPVMRIEIFGTESLGVRGLSCRVEAGGRVIFIDPGIALGYRRHGLLPHPFQVAVGRSIRRRIISALKEATDIVISHYHGDHIPLVDANPYQLDASMVPALKPEVRFWTRSTLGLSVRISKRAEALSFALDREFHSDEGKGDEVITCSQPMPHGVNHSRLGSVMMTRIEDEGDVFVHASDIQLLNRESVAQIIEWHPHTVLTSGPPLYLRRLSPQQRGQARQNALSLSRAVDTLIVDHHIARSERGIGWLKQISSETGGRVICAADYMNRPRLLLEAWRRRLYRDMPVPENWHDAYARGEADVKSYTKWRAHGA